MEHVDHCSQRFDELFAQGKPVSMEWALKSLAMGMYLLALCPTSFHHVCDLIE